MSTDPTSHYRPGQIGNDFREFARPQADEPVIEKTTNSAFIGTNLDAWLKERRVNKLIIVGVITNNSVEATVRMSGNLGFDTTVVSDGAYTFGRDDYSGRWRTAQEVHDLSLANLQGEYAQILSTDQLLVK